MRNRTNPVRLAVLTLALSGTLALGASAASLGAGTVTASALRLRAEPSTSASILATATSGCQVVVLSEEGGGWYKVDFNTIEGYMYGDFLEVKPETEADLGYAYITTGSSSLNLRSGPGTAYGKVASIPGSSVVPICGISESWYKVTYAGCTGYISSDYVQLVKDTNGTRADGDDAQVASASSDSTLGSQIISYAKQYLGCPYVYGASGPSRFDCSGFTKYVYAHFGYSLNRSANDQLKNGVKVARTAMEPGDLVFFKATSTKSASHVGIYIGNGQFIHASSTGDVVKISDLSSGYYCSVLVGVRRIL